MPFPNVTKHGVTRNFEQIINSLVSRFRPLLALENLVPDADGWTLEDDLAGLSFEGAQSADIVWSAAIDKDGNSRAGLLEEKVKALSLIVSRQDEQLSSLQVGIKRHLQLVADDAGAAPNAHHLDFVMRLAAVFDPSGINPWTGQRNDSYDAP